MGLSSQEDFMKPSNVTIIGLQWGDEGKGKVVDAVAGKCRYVARFCGGANAGHSVNVQGERYALHLVPSGILNAGVRNCIGNGVVFDPPVALEEIDDLIARGVKIGPENLSISSSAHVVMSWHKLADKLMEARLGGDKIGTTARGIGPCYSDKASRSLAIRVCDLLDEAVLAEKVHSILAVKNPMFAALFNQAPLDEAAIVAEYAAYGRRLAPMVCDTGSLLRKATAAGERICFEGGQGSMLDIDHGTFPFVTSSSVTACGVPSGAGVPPKALGYIVGVIKCYTSRVGAGPFPTEQDNPIGDLIRRRGKEFGTTTGRPRRTGWLDAVAVRYAAELSGVDELAIMLLLDGEAGLDTFRICTAYKYNGKTITEFDPSLPLDKVEPVYEDWPAWQSPIGGVKRYEDLPVEARKYVERIEQLIARPIGLISVGVGREQTLFHQSRLPELAK